VTATRTVIEKPALGRRWVVITDAIVRTRHGWPATDPPGALCGCSGVIAVSPWNPHA
jgi:hypothetical protein